MHQTKTIWEIFWDVKIWWTPARERAEYFWWWIPWVSIKDMWKWKYVSVTNETLSESWVQNSNVKLIKKGSLLFSFKLTVWRMCFAWTDLYTNEAIAAFEPNPEIMLEYLYYVLPVATKQVKRTNNFWAPLLNKDQIKKLRIPLPPLETQKAIVVKLDQIFAELDQTKSEIQKNLDNTDELWKSTLNQVFQGDWEMKKLGEVCDVRDWTHDSPKYYDEWIPFITSKNLKEDWIDFDNVNYISKEDHINFSTRSKVEVWDILFAMIWTIWNPTIVKDKREFSIKNVALIKFWWTENILNTYVRYLLDSDFTINNLSANSRWGTQKFIALKDIRNFVIPVPPLSEQEKIVEHLDQVSKEVKALKSQYQSQLDNLEELKKSMLDKTFRWELLS